MKSTAGFILFVLLVVGLLFSLSGKRHPRVPNDVLHKNLEITNSAGQRSISAAVPLYWSGTSSRVEMLQ